MSGVDLYYWFVAGFQFGDEDRLRNHKHFFCNRRPNDERDYYTHCSRILLLPDLDVEKAVWWFGVVIAIILLLLPSSAPVSVEACSERSGTAKHRSAHQSTLYSFTRLPIIAFSLSLFISSRIAFLSTSSTTGLRTNLIPSRPHRHFLPSFLASFILLFELLDVDDQHQWLRLSYVAAVRPSNTVLSIVSYLLIIIFLHFFHTFRTPSAALTRVLTHSGHRYRWLGV